MTSPHDPHLCGICLDHRAARLRRRGVHANLVRALRDAGTAAVEQVLVLESATSDQIAAVNRLEAQRLAVTV